MRLELQWPPHYRWWGLAVGSVVAAALLAMPFAWPLRMGLASFAWMLAALMWEHHYRRSPTVLTMDAAGRVGMRCRSGLWLDVDDVDIGIVRPWLVSARLRVTGSARDLFVPGRTLPPETHWQLRRLVLGFRPDGAGQS